MHLSDSWAPAFEESSGEINLRVNLSSGDNGLPGGQELSDLLRNVITVDGKVNIIFSS